MKSIILYGLSRDFLIAIIYYLLMVSCSWKPVHEFSRLPGSSDISTRNKPIGLCTDTENYIPWEGETGVMPIRIIRMNFHFMNNSDGSQNLSGESALRFAETLIQTANHDLAHNQQMRLPLHNNTPVLDPLMRYEIVMKQDGSPAVYEHFDDEYYYLIKKGPHRNNYNRSVIDRYGVGLDSILNVFVQVPPPDSLMPDNYGGLKTGVALRNSIRISGPLLTDARVWSYVGMFNHEVGHILGLRHSWGLDQCADTPQHTNCWNFTNDGSVCDSLVSNNVMDSNADQDAWTPCQIGILQRSLTEERRYQRKLAKTTYCFQQSDKPIYIRDTVVWCREMDVAADVLIKSNSKLIISNRVSMPEGSRIYIEKGGQLILRKTARLLNACRLSWEGIYSKSPLGQSVLVEEGAEIIMNDEL